MKKGSKPNVCIVIVKDDYTDSLVNLLSTHVNIESVIFIGDKPITEVIEELNNVSVNTYKLSIFGNNTGINWNNNFIDSKFELRSSSKERINNSLRLYDISIDYDIKMIGFGYGSIFLSLNKGCSLLFNKCKPKTHNITFLVGENEDDLRFDVETDHSILIYPVNLRNFQYNIKAFGTYYSQLKYFNSNGEVVEVGKNFVEPEIISFGNVIAFQYDVPNKDNAIVCDLTMQNIMRV